MTTKVKQTDLMKKHHQVQRQYITIPFNKGDGLRDLIEKTSKSLGISYKEIARQGVLYYCIFMRKELEHLAKEDEKNNKKSKE